MAEPMTDDEPFEESGHDPLRAGLRAAFGPGSPAFAGARVPGAARVLTAIEEESGVQIPTVSLRDERGRAEGGTTFPPPSSGERDSTRAPAQGTGRYELAGEIARGGIGVVIQGRDRDLGRDVALKLLRAEHASNPAMVRRLVEEAQIGGQLQHPGVLPVYELGLDADGRPYFAMRLIRGQTLSALLQARNDPAQDRRRFLGVFEQVCQTMAYAHARGVIHRDLKPANIMVGAFGEVQVVDWGLAKVLDRGDVTTAAPGAGNVGDPAQCPGGPEAVAAVRLSGSGATGPRSEAGSVLGTPAYMPPEQARGGFEPLDERADVFALGAILCEILTGRPPYADGPREDRLRRAAEGRLDEAMARLDASGADRELVDLACRCLAPDRRDRPGDAGQVARAVSSYLASVEERARAAELEAAEARARAAAERRARRLTAAAALALLGLAAGLALALQSVRAYLHAERALLDSETQRRESVQAQLKAEQAYRQAEEKRLGQFASTLATISSLQQKGRLLIDLSQRSGPLDANRWIQVLAVCRAAVEHSAQIETDAATRRRMRDLAQELRQAEDHLRAGAGRRRESQE